MFSVGCFFQRYFFFPFPPFEKKEDVLVYIVLPSTFYDVSAIILTCLIAVASFTTKGRSSAACARRTLAGKMR